VLKDGALEGTTEAALIESIRANAAKSLSAFKVPGPGLLFIADALPKGATGKVQRRHMPAAFLPAEKAANGNGAAAAAPAPALAAAK
jgi:acyl-coenzyme A synthetase/AMP-(fatty) acid ligase